MTDTEALERELIERLDELDLDMVMPGDPLHPAVRNTNREEPRLFYTPDGTLIDEDVVAAANIVEEYRRQPEYAPAWELFVRDGLPGYVSTQYLGLNLNTMSFSLVNSLPLIYETMVFVGHESPPRIAGQWRYASSAAAKAGHKQVVAVCQAWAAKT